MAHLSLGASNVDERHAEANGAARRLPLRAVENILTAA